MTTPKIAYDTIHYAVECLMHGEMKSFAIDVIYENDNVLTEPQKQAIAEQIRALSDRPRTVKEMNQLENRLIGAVQPATLQVLASPKLLAEVIYFFLGPHSRSLNLPESKNHFQALSIQSDSKEIDRSLVRRHLRDKVDLDLTRMNNLLEKFHGKASYNFFLESHWTKEEIQQLLALAPKFYKLSIRDSYTSGFLIKVAEAIRDGETQFSRLSDKTTEKDALPIENTSLLFPLLSHLKVSRFLERGELTQLVQGIPTLKVLSIALDWDIFEEEYKVLNQLNLTRLDLWLDIDGPNAGFTEEDVEALKTLPLRDLDLFGSGGFDNAQLLLLKRLPHLHTLNLSKCDLITAEGIAAFAQENASIKTIIFYEAQSIMGGITQQDINWLEITFPHIHFETLIDVESAS